MKTRRENEDWLISFLDYAKDSETPFKVLYWSGVSAVAGALRRNVFLDQGRYTLYPNFYIVLVARPGVIQKTTTINYAIKLLKEVKDINFSPKACTWEAFITTLEGMHEMDTDGKPLSVDSTVTKTAAISVIAGELSMFLDTENKFMVSALTDLWDCPDDFEKVTKFSGSEFIEKPCVNLVAGTTPAWMRESFDRFSREGGLVSRIIFVYANEKRQLVAHPVQAPKELQRKLTVDLEYIGNLKGEFRMTAEARHLSEIWYVEHNTRTDKGVTDATGFNERKQAHILKLAMVISASRRDTLVITDSDLQDAIVKVNEVEADFTKSFEVLHDRTELKPYADLREAIKQAGTIKKQVLIARFTHRFTMREMDEALKALASADEIEIIQGMTGFTFKWRTA